jgi:hypothetical protein
MENDPLKMLTAAWRGDLDARRLLLRWLRREGRPSLAAVLRPALAADEDELDGWLLGQLLGPCGLGAAEADLVMPWRSGPAAAAAVCRALEARSGEPWQARVIGEAQPLQVVRSAAPRLDEAGQMPPGERQKLALLLGLPEAYVKPAGLAMPATPGELRGLVLRAEGEGG